ncbi:MAG: DNA repair protein RecN [Saprospiraceae bacterium]|nr:DNA repair protein RecN [Saprospiraceae bacterium]
MIRKIHIRNYAIIENLEIDFSDKLTIITGETGAGKSILLGALGLIMGNRADNTKVLYNEQDKCIIEAYFSIDKYDVKSFFDENDLDYEPEIIIRRELTPNGKSRAFINDTPVNLKLLQTLSSTLIDLHQQFDTLDIHEVSFQLRMIDALADNKDYLYEYQQSFKNFTQLKKTLQQLINKNENSAREIEYINFQISEFNNAELIDGEQIKLEKELFSLNNSEDIKRTLLLANNFLTESEDAVISKLNDIGSHLNGIKKYDKNLMNIYDRFYSAQAELQDIASELETLSDHIEHDPERIQEINERLNIIYKLLKKHNVGDVTQLIEIKDNLQNQLDKYADLSNEISNLEKEIDVIETDLLQKAKVLTQRRSSVIPSFQNKVEELLSKLSMENAKLKIDIQPISDLSYTGKDEIQFLFSTNKGSKFLPIKDVASGGELSRLTLCTKSLVASAIPLPTLIFDEIDAGVSGDVALKMGKILRQLSSHHQVIIITHSPQVASMANKHYYVFKEDLADRTITKVKELVEHEKINNIAIMLSSNPPTLSAIENAKELLAVALK